MPGTGFSQLSVPKGQPSLTQFGRNFWGVAWNPNGNYAVLTAQDGTVAVFDGQYLNKVHSDIAKGLGQAAWKPGGDFLVCVDTQY